MIFRLDMIPTALRALGRFLKRVFGPEPVVVSDEVMFARKVNCSTCPFNLDGQCTLCGCALSLKVVMASERCPRTPPRWTEQTRFSNGL